ncbi:acyl-CoA thioesterase [Pseudalkalibacillus caeni]|uniref:Acyl-CoA thioesterase n=1 Tax=Exobacillus caeni TaxID=2574798 RepID=A0A5R9F523_9BACL|nr:thioesterase family protein [Pseudalkalibacillus caeni]TLS37446.1 acyl-CoA thioesterase [Pseudalkalibacillus caeni]
MTIVRTKVNVRYAETDQMGVVYHANYLVWFELGRTELINSLGFNYAEMEEQGVLSPVTDVELKYIKPLRYGQTATVKTWVEKYDGLRVIYAYEIYNQEEELSVTGKSTHICVRKETFKPISIRRTFPDWHEAYLNAAEQ